MMVPLLIQGAASPGIAAPLAAPDCAKTFCISGAQIAELPDFHWHCRVEGRGDFVLDVAGSPKPHMRSGRFVPVGKARLPAGVADNRYAPLALFLNSGTKISESFELDAEGATYYTVMSYPVTARHGDEAAAEDFSIGPAHFEMNKSAQPIAKRFAEGTCTLMEEPQK